MNHGLKEISVEKFQRKSEKQGCTATSSLTLHLLFSLTWHISNTTREEKGWVPRMGSCNGSDLKDLERRVYLKKILSGGIGE